MVFSFFQSFARLPSPSGTSKSKLQGSLKNAPGAPQFQALLCACVWLAMGAMSGVWAAGSSNASPTPLSLIPVPSERPPAGKTEITAQQEATFNNAANQAIFVGDVVVKDPQFTLFCDRLVVFLNKNQQGLKRAEATGHVTIVQENKPNQAHTGHTKSVGKADSAKAQGSEGIASSGFSAVGMPGAHTSLTGGLSSKSSGNQEGQEEVKSIGRANRAIFEPATGDMILMDSPQIQQGANNHVGDPSTVMILNRNGHLTTQGSSRTVIVDLGSH